MENCKVIETTSKKTRYFSLDVSVTEISSNNGDYRTNPISYDNKTYILTDEKAVIILLQTTPLMIN